MSIEQNKAVVGKWFTEFWGKEFNPAVIDELAAPDIRFGQWEGGGPTPARRSTTCRSARCPLTPAR